MNQHMTTEQFNLLREQWLDGDITAQDQERLEAYLTENPGVAKQLQEEKQYLTSLAVLDLQVVEQSQNTFVQNVLGEFESQSTPVTYTLPNYLRPILLAAAALIMAVMIWVFTPNANTTLPEIAATPGKATSPLSVLLRETHTQYTTKSEQVSQTLNTPTTILSFSNFLDAIAPAPPSNNNASENEQG